MNIVIYDGSIEGFLTLIHECYKSRFIPNIITKTSIKQGLLNEYLYIQTDLTKAQKVLHSIKKKFPKRYFHKIMHIFLCDESDFELSLLHYIILGFKNINNLNNINHPSIYKIDKLEKELFRLTHRMYGFIRFEELEDKTLYSKIDTKFNLLPMVGKYFNQKLNPYDFIIHDIKRELAFIKQDSSTQILKVSKFQIPTNSNSEEKFQKLWKVFFSKVSIKERENKKLQQSFVPLIYRKHMLEFY